MRLLASMLVLTFAVACGGGTGSTPAPRASATGSAQPATTTPTSAPASVSAALPSGEQLCALLASSEWGQFNYVTAAQPEIESDGPGSAYCTYAGESGAEGGLELDAFVAETVSDAEATFDLMSTEQGGQVITLPGADEAWIHPAIDDEFGAISVRVGRFSYSISLPTGEQAEAQLLALAGIVLARASALR